MHKTLKWSKSTFEKRFAQWKNIVWRLYANYIHYHPKRYHGQIRKDELIDIFEYQTLFAKKKNFVLVTLQRVIFHKIFSSFWIKNENGWIGRYLQWKPIPKWRGPKKLYRWINFNNLLERNYSSIHVPHINSSSPTAFQLTLWNNKVIFAHT